MVRTQVQLTKEQAEALKKRAADLDVSVAEIIRRSIDAAVCRPIEMTAHERRQRAIEMSGLFISGNSDLGTNHDRYLAEDVLS